MQLRPYQADVLSFSDRANGRFIYADAAGSGKTPTTSALLAAQGIPQGRSALVVAPDGVVDHWLDEIALWTPYRPLDGRGVPEARARAREALGEPGAAPGVLVVTHELLRRDRDALLKGRIHNLVVDEAHRLKGRGKLRSNAAGFVGRRVPFITLITGTPILNRPEELWVLLNMLDHKRFGSFWRWAYLHFDVELTTFHGKLEHPVPIIGELKEGHDVLIQLELEDVMISRPMDELIPDLPPVTNHIVPVQLSDEERRAYDHMMSKGWTHINGKLVETSNALSKLTRLRQLSSDWSGLVEHEGLSLGAKTAAAAELLDTSQQVVTLAAYRAPVDRLMEVLPDAVRYDGSVTPKQRKRAIAAFAAGDVQHIVGTIAAMGEGLDGLQVASSLVRLDRDVTPARNEQIIARIRRSGQTAPCVHVVDIVASDTTDEWVADLLARKTAGIERVMVR